MTPREPRYEIVDDSETKLVIRDLGPWDVYPTVTNRAEEVVEALADQLKGRRLYCLDSEGDMDELLVVNGRFGGFGPGSDFDPRDSGQAAP